jgi:hypothetical protein
VTRRVKEGEVEVVGVGAVDQITKSDSDLVILLCQGIVGHRE